MKNHYPAASVRPVDDRTSEGTVVAGPGRSFSRRFDGPDHAELAHLWAETTANRFAAAGPELDYRWELER